MSLHPSLHQSDSKDASRTVLKREERIKKMAKKGEWTEKSKVFGLPKTKIVKMKVVKKEKKQETPEKEETTKAPAK